MVLLGCIDEFWCSLTATDAQILKKVEKHQNQVNTEMECYNGVKMKKKILKIDGVKEKRILKFCENNSMLLDCCSHFIYPSRISDLNTSGGYMLICREYYVNDLKELQKCSSVSNDDICSVICSLCNILLILNGYDIVVNNLKSSNITYDDGDISGNIKLCDININTLRKIDEMADSIGFISPEELNGQECDDKNVVWSLGCLLYEMLIKKSPFYEDNNVIKTISNIMKCEYNQELIKDKMMKEIIKRMLKVKSKDRISLNELYKEMVKMREYRESENNVMICNEKREILFHNDYLIETAPFDIQGDYYLQYNKNELIRNDLIDKYNSKANIRLLALLLMIKLYKEDMSIESKLKFQHFHFCKECNKDDYLDKMINKIHTGLYNNDTIYINSRYMCLCEEGIDYLFKILELIKPNKLSFNIIDIPTQRQQTSFGSYFCHLTRLEQIKLSDCHLTFYFIESFIKSIQLMKIGHINIEHNPIGSKGFRLLLPYLNLLINKENELNMEGMNINDESVKELSEKLYKYPNIKRINVKDNQNIRFKGLKSLFSKFPITGIDFDFNDSKDLLIDEDIPELIKYIQDGCDRLILYDSEINDETFESFISLRIDELRPIKELYLNNNNLTSKSVEILIDNLSSLPNLKYVSLDGNEISDRGMEILCPHLDLIKDCFDEINCSRMGLSLDGLKYLINGLKSIPKKIVLDLSENNINSDGVEYLMSYVKETEKISKLIIHDNPIGNDGFKLLENNFNILQYTYDEMNLSSLLIDDESVILLANKIDALEKGWRINLNGNNISFNGLKYICSKSLEKSCNAFIVMNYPSWTNDELKYYLKYCKKKKRYSYNFSNLNLNDSHIQLFKHRSYYNLDLSNNRITYKGLKELTKCLPKTVDHISISNNPIGDKGIKIICQNLDIFIAYSSLNLSNVGMNEKGLKRLMKGLKDFKALKQMNLDGNELNERELELMIEKKGLFDNLDKLSIEVKENINRSMLESFLKTFTSIGIIKLNGIDKDEKKLISKQFLNVE